MLYTHINDYPVRDRLLHKRRTALTRANESETMPNQHRTYKYDDLIPKIDRALKRVDDGTYGKCTQCGEAISLDRLSVLPEAEHCMECLKWAT